MFPDRVLVGALGALISVLLVACGGVLPNSAISRHQANRYAGALTAATPIATVIRDRGLHVPDQASSVPLLEQLRDQLARSDATGAFAGITYDLTYGNTLPRDWLVQSPNRWGRAASDLPFYPLACKDCDPDLLLPACSTDADCRGGTCAAVWPRPETPRGARRKVCLGHSDALVLQLHDLVAGAQRRVDIALLQPPPDTRFLGALRDALQVLARRGRPVTVRIVIGQYPPDNVDVAAFLAALTSGLEQSSPSRLAVSVAAMRSCIVFEDCDSYSWNHAKIVSVDGTDTMVGGHNLWSADYLVDNPVHDLSMRVHGPAAASAARFTDRLWDYICANLDKKPEIVMSNFAMGMSLPAGGCAPTPAAMPSAPKAGGGVPILAVGRMGAGITKDFANQSELARDLMLGAAQHDIRIAQQDLGFMLGRADPLFPESTIDRLIDFLQRRDGHIYIVLSNLGAAGDTGSSYSNDVPLKAVAKHLRAALQARYERRDPFWRYEMRRGPDPINAVLCERVHLAPFRFGPDASWPGGKSIANHAKFWMVDERAFYIGSDNMYPVNLQEFGYIVDDGKAAREVIDAYWTPLWQWSQRAAVSGAGVKDCIFREPVK
jgi:phosphatidylserine/phosphatidylglycerophosphate/cardiolipin synthase-like enzyme